MQLPIEMRSTPRGHCTILLSNDAITSDPSYSGTLKRLTYTNYESCFEHNIVVCHFVGRHSVPAHIITGHSVALPSSHLNYHAASFRPTSKSSTNVCVRNTNVQYTMSVQLINSVHTALLLYIGDRHVEPLRVQPNNLYKSNTFKLG